MIIYGGLSDGNKGVIQVGVVVENEKGQKVNGFGFGYVEGKNGTAEWMAAYAGLRIIEESNYLPCQVVGANKPVIYGMIGRNKTKSPHVKQIAERCIGLVRKLEKVSFQLVDRDKCVPARKAFQMWKNRSQNVNYLSLRPELWEIGERAEMICSRMKRK